MTGDEMDVNVTFEMNSTFDYPDDYSMATCVPTHEPVFIQVMFYIALVLGLLGNALVLAVLWQKRRSWRVTDTFVLNLSLVDILLLLSLPFWAVNAITGWSLGSKFCQFVAVIFKMNIYFGMFLLPCISVHHFLLIVKNFRMYSLERLWAPHATCLAVWVASFLLSIGDWINLGAVRDPAYLDRDWCPLAISRSRGGAALFLVVAVIMVLAYALLMVRLQSQNGGEDKKQSKRRRAVWPILALAAVFFLSWAPYNVALVVDPQPSGADDCPERNRTAMEMALIATAAVGCLMCVAKPLLYLALARVFRKRALDLLRCRSSPQSNHKVSLWDSGGEEEEEEDGSAAEKRSFQSKC